MNHSPRLKMVFLIFSFLSLNSCFLFGPNSSEKLVELSQNYKDENKAKILDLINAEKTDANFADKTSGRTALMNLIYQGAPNELIEALLKKQGLDINKADQAGATALHYAVLSSSKEYGRANDIVLMILKRPEANLNGFTEKNWLNYEAHMSALKLARGPCTQILLNDPRLDLNAASVDGESALLYLARTNDYEAIEMMIQTGRLNLKHRDEKTRGLRDYFEMGRSSKSDLPFDKDRTRAILAVSKENN